MNRRIVFGFILTLAVLVNPGQAVGVLAPPSGVVPAVASDRAMAPTATLAAGNIIYAGSCSQTGVQAAIDAASDGDFVLVPAGTCTWTTPAANTPAVRINNKAVTLLGAGIDTTIIVDGTNNDYWGSSTLSIQGVDGKPFRVSGFTFLDVNYPCAICISGTSQAWRVDHIRTTADGGPNSVSTRGYTYGVIDHSEFNNQRVLVIADDDLSWSRPLSLGSADTVYIEDNVFNLQLNGAAVDANIGGRFVFRYNQVIDGMATAHGRDSSGGRSSHSYEIYGNAFTTTLSPFRGSFLRGGTGVVWDNTWMGGYQRPIDVTNYCSCYDNTPGYCAFDRCTAYPCIDQVGRTTGQVLAPLYEWGNTINGNDADITVYNFPECANPSVFDHIQENRDYYNDTVRPGYTPYVYPHPVTKELVLSSRPASGTIHLDWQVKTILPPTTTWRIDYYTQTVIAPFTATEPLSTTRSTVLTEHVDNYQWYTITLSTVGVTPPLSDTVRVMPTDKFVYLPLVLRASHSTTNPTHQGVATYYNATGAGACSFDPSPSDLMVAAMNAEEYDNAAVCGAYASVTGPNGTVTVRIVDLCPGCGAGHLDLSREAFAKIADLPQGIVPITWRVVSPALTGPIAYHFKDGSNQWWTAVQIRNHRNPVAKLEYRNGSDQWITVPRTSYNYFVQTNPGMGLGPYTFRVTDAYGNTLADTGIPHVENGTVNGAAQFPPGP